MLAGAGDRHAAGAADPHARRGPKALSSSNTTDGSPAGSVSFRERPAGSEVTALSVGRHGARLQPLNALKLPPQ